MMLYNHTCLKTCCKTIST